jgi:hypothetical protein
MRNKAGVSKSGSNIFDRCNCGFGFSIIDIIHKIAKPDIPNFGDMTIYSIFPIWLVYKAFFKPIFQISENGLQ